jgi:hypothetical protein
MYWQWTARRLLISAFLVAHIGATIIWVLPGGVIRERTLPALRYYLMPLGLWQFWAMFAPDPVRDTYMLEAEVVDARGLRYNFQFPRIADYSAWQAIPRFRYSKYAANMSINEFELPREFAARHVARQLNLLDEAFPVDVRLFYKVRLTPPPGTSEVDPLAPLKTAPLGSYQFKSASEVRP